MRHKPLVWFGVALAAVSGLGAWAGLKGQRAGEFRTVRVDRGSIASTISATGNLNAVVTVEVGSQVSGNVKELYANFNTKVKKGQLVARIDPEIFDARVNQAQANLLSAQAAVATARATMQKNEADISNAKAQIAIAQANLAKEKVNTANSKTTYGRQLSLYQQGLIAAADRDTAQAAYDAAEAQAQAAQAQVQAATDNVRSAQAQEEVAKAQLATAQAQVAQQGAALKQAQIDLEHTYIYAPVDGTVIARKVDVGQTVVASMQAPSLFQIAQDLTKMQVDTNVDEADVGRVKVGQATVFTVDAFPGRQFHGQVVEIRQAPINVQNVITYDVVIGVNNADLKLLPGMTANVKVLVDRRDDALRIPNSALRYRPVDTKPAAQQAGARQFGNHKPGAAMTQTVYVAGPNGKPVAQQVKLGITDGMYSEVVSGLNEGQEVIVGAARETAQASGQQGFGGGRRGPGF